MIYNKWIIEHKRPMCSHTFIEQIQVFVYIKKNKTV